MAARTQKLNLTRDQLASFLKDPEQIKQFEMLFDTVSELLPNNFEGISILAGNADARSQEALDAINRLADAIELAATTPAVISASTTTPASSDSSLLAESRQELGRKSSLQVLTWLDM